MKQVKIIYPKSVKICKGEERMNLPALELVTIEHSPNAADILKKPASRIDFPLSPEIIALIEAMKKKVIEIDGVGLAANQVGYHVKVIVYHVPEAVRSYREDALEEVPLSVLINPSYTPIEEDGIFADWEGCFSVAEKIGKVKRYKSIHYQGQTPTGETIKAKANGFLARVLQHEIDHINGFLIIDRLTPSCIQGDPKEMKAIREKEYEAQLKKSNEKKS